MSDFKIVIDYQNPTFKRQIKEGKNALVDFHVMVRGQAFPGAPFLDFPVIVLGWWLEGYMQLVDGDEPVENTFMNGPFEFESSLNGDQVVLSFWERTRMGKREANTPLALPLSEYKAELVQASQVLIDTLDRLLLTSPDISHLKTIFESVKEQHKTY